MAEWVVDTNVWVVADGGHPEASGECEGTCLAWLVALGGSADEIVVDDGWLILGEYRGNLRRGDYAEKVLNVLQRDDRLRWVALACDSRGDPLVPPPLRRLHRKDRKFAAAALARDPHPPIVNAVDPGYTDCAVGLAEVGLTVQELCRADLERPCRD